MSVEAARGYRAKLRKPALLAAGTVLLLVMLAASAAPRLAPYDFQTQDLSATYAAPQRAHLLGTDALGRDLLSRLIFGARISVGVALTALLLVLGVGVPVGLIAGYYGGALDFVLMRLVDILFALPDLLMLIIVSAYLAAALPRIESGPWLVLRGFYDATGGLAAVVLALALLRWLRLARLVRGQILGLREREFVQAARALGATDRRIVLRHLLPNALAPIAITAALAFPQFIIAEAGLSFIGLGARPPTPSWGVMIAGGVSAMRSHPGVALAPSLAIAITLLCVNYLADGLQNALDPLLRR